MSVKVMAGSETKRESTRMAVAMPPKAGKYPELFELATRVLRRLGQEGNDAE